MERAWHFVADTLRDGRPIPPDGEWLVHKGDLVMCASGLHASTRIIDALKYAPGNTCCLVDVDGAILRQGDKLVAEMRRIVWRIDAEHILFEASRLFALDVIHFWDAPDIVREFLETGNEDLRAAAQAAANAATWAATSEDAAWAAAWAATREDAAWAAAGAAARAATRAATRAAAWDAAVSAAREKQNTNLLDLLIQAGAPVDAER